MKECPYCKEQIRDAAIKCKYCGNYLKPVEEVTLALSGYKESKLYWGILVSALILYDILLISSWLSINDLTSALFTAIYLIWDIFFGYFLLRAKKWAKICIASRIIFRLLFRIKPTFLWPSLFTVVELLFLIGFVFLLLVKNKGLINKIKISFVSLAYILSITLMVNIIILNMECKNAILNTPLINEQKSNKGFKITLPSSNWRFLKKDTSLKFIGKFTENADIVLSDTSGRVYGCFIGEDLTELKGQVTLEHMAQDIKENILKNYKIINERKDDNSILIESQLIDNYETYVFAAGSKELDRAMVSCYFWGKSEDYNRLRDDIYSLLNNISEISRKEYLVKISSKEIYERNSDAVVLVRVYDRGGKPTAFASGFNIFKEGLIVTNLHAIIPGYYVDVKFPNYGVFEDVYIVGLSKTLCDLVLLKIEGKDLPVVNLNNSAEAELGEDAIVISNPKGLVNSISEGIVSGVRDIEGLPYYQITSPISKGSSGGPVFDSCGNIIGICVSTLEGGQNLNFCIPVAELSNIEFYKEGITLTQLQELLKEENKADKASTSEPPLNLSIDGIAWSGKGDSYAMINGVVLRKNDWIGKYQVISIEKTRVTLKKGKETLELKLNEK